MYRLKAVTFLLLTFPLIVFAEGTVVETTFFSQALGQEKNVSVYLPEGYGNHWWMRYPVIYYLHGAGQMIGHDEFPELVVSLDQMIGSGEIWPVILVRPAGFTSPYPAGFYTSSALYGDIEGCMIDDLIQWTDDNYQTIPWKRKRAVMGHSMGAYGAIKYYGEHPDLYCAAAGVCLSGADWPTMLELNVYGILSELTGPPYNYNPSAGFSNAVLFSISGAFTPNLANPPFYVDLPLDEYANVIPEVFAIWMEHNLPEYLGWLGTDCWWNRTTVYFDAGTEDLFQTVPACDALAMNLDAMGVNYQYDVFEGGHFDKLGERFPIALEFLCTAMHHRWGWWWDSQAGTGNIEAVPLCEEITGIVAFHNAAERSVSFELLESSSVSVSIYDGMGRIVATPVDGPLEAGYHSIGLESENLSAGVYFYAIAAGDRVVTGKILMVP